MDITERKLAEALDARLAAIVAAADDAIFSLSPEGIILSWNPAGARVFGYAAEEIIGQSVRILYPAGADAEFQERYAQVRRGEHVRTEARRIRKDGTSLNASITLAPILSSDGRVAGVSAVVRDISERKRLEEKLVETWRCCCKPAISANSPSWPVEWQRSNSTSNAGQSPVRKRFMTSSASRATRPFSTCKILSPTFIPTIARVCANAGASQRRGRHLRRRIQDSSSEWRQALALPACASLNDRHRPSHVHGVSMDITERKEHEAHIRFLMSEISHRSKNLLAVVQAIAAQTARTSSSSAGFAADFGARAEKPGLLGRFVGAAGVARRIHERAGALPTWALRRQQRSRRNQGTQRLADATGRAVPRHGPP